MARISKRLMRRVRKKADVDTLSYDAVKKEYEIEGNVEIGSMGGERRVMIWRRTEGTPDPLRTPQSTEHTVAYLAVDGIGADIDRGCHFDGIYPKRTRYASFDELWRVLTGRAPHT